MSERRPALGTSHATLVQRRAARRRGATYTLVIVASSFLILITGGLLLRSSGHVLEHSAYQSRTVQAREAAFAGVRWAARHAERGGDPEVQAALRLFQADVTVDGRPGATPRERRVSAKAVVLDVQSTVTARLAEVDGEWRLAAADVETRTIQRR